MNLYIGELRIFATASLPPGWFLCDGRYLNRDRYSDLFRAIGTTYGGDGEPLFQIPDLQGRTLAGAGLGDDDQYVLGQVKGTARVQLLEPHLPPHRHPAYAGEARQGEHPGHKEAANHDSLGRVYHWNDYVIASAWSPVDAHNWHYLARESVGQSGGDVPHENRQPYMALSIGIAGDPWALHGGV